MRIVNLFKIFEVKFEIVANFTFTFDVPCEILLVVLYLLEFAVGAVLHHRLSIQIIYIVVHEVCSVLSRILVGDIWIICAGAAIAALIDAASDASTFNE